MNIEIKVGDSRTVTREVTDELVRQFASLSGDHNPIHLDDSFAENTRFGRRIAHGMLTGAFISAVLGNGFRGQTIVYLSQSMRFTAPVFIGDTVAVTAAVSHVREDRGIITLAVTCTNQRGETTLTGESVLMVMPKE